MKFGESGDPVNAYSFLVQEGYSTPAWAYDKAVKILEFIDGTMEVLNFGAREHRSAEFDLNYIPRAQFYALKAYADANLGQPIRVTIENAGERVFGEQLTAGAYYGYLMEFRTLGEQAFTSSHEMYGCSLKLDLAGSVSTSVPNAADTSQYDFLHVMDCARITPGCQVANLTALNAITTQPGGSRGLTTGDLKVYFFNSDPARKVAGVVVGPGWEYQYTLPANDPARGLKYGVFRWSAFADVSGSSTGVGGEDFKSGWIVERSIKPPRYSVDARQGPALEHPEGYSLAAANYGKLWKFPLDNNLAFYGAHCGLYAYDRLSGVLTLLRTGYNSRNEFDYAQLNFEVEPGVFLQNKSFPVNSVGPANFPKAAADMKGKPVLTTFGRWDKGRVQTVAFNMDAIAFPIGKKYLGVTAWDGATKKLTIDLPVTEVTAVLGYDPTSGGAYPVSPTNLLYVAIYSQSGQPDVKKLKRVTAVETASGLARFTLSADWVVPIDTTAIVVIYLSNIQILLDQNAAVGLRAPNFLVTGVEGQKLDLELYGKSNGVLTRIPSRMFKVVDDGKESQITVDSDYISLESNGDMIVEDHVGLSPGNPSYLHDIIDKTHVDGYRYFDFGFTPRGQESTEIEVQPRVGPFMTSLRVEKVSRSITKGGEGWNDSTSVASAAIQAAYSRDFATLIWTPVQGASGYRLTRWLSTWSDKAQGTAYKVDSAFGNPGNVELKDGTVLHGSNGVVVISGGSAGIGDGAAFVAIDKSISNTEQWRYQYTLEAIVGSAFQPALYSNIGQCRSVPQGSHALTGVSKDTAVVLAWPVPDNQVSYTVVQDGTDLGSMPVTSTTKGWHEVTGLTNGQGYKFKVAINCLSIGAATDTWFFPAGVVSDHGVHQLLHAGNPYFDFPFLTQRDSKNCDLTDPTNLAYARSWGVVTRKRDNNASLDFPAAGVVFSMLWKIPSDDERLKDLSGAKDVRLLTDMVIRSWIDDHTPQAFIIQLRGLRADKSVAFTVQYKDMTPKTPTEGGAYGAFAEFLNLPPFAGGSTAHYETDNSTPNTDGLYTGKALWTLPDWLFEDGAREWAQIEYFMFSVTNSTSIPAVSMAMSPQGAHAGYHLGVGGPPTATWSQVREHKPVLYLEYVRTFDGGLREPLYARIDGGIVDDGAGTITGTAGRLIEKARHVADSVVTALTGQKPVYIGTEMQSRDAWIWHFQANQSKTMQETLQTVLNNLWAIGTITPDDRFCIRSLDVDEPNNAPVLALTDANILKDSLKKDGRRRDEIYQKFRLKYNIDPTVNDGTATEEMNIGWDLAASQPLFAGYSRTLEDDAGNIKDVDGMDGMDSLVRISTQLYAASLAVNEYGTDPAAEKVFEMFYRPTRPSRNTRTPVERDLPNLGTLWPGAKAPKIAMQELARKVVKYLCLDAWYFSLSISLKHAIYNSAITGKKDEAGTPDHRLKLGDLVTLTSDFYTNGEALKGFILDMELAPMYDGYITLHVFCPRPPGQFGTFVDKVWNAGAPGPRNEANFLFTGTLYGLRTEAGTFADAKGPGSRNTANMTFPDGSFADAQGQGSGKA